MPSELYVMIRQRGNEALEDSRRYRNEGKPETAEYWSGYAQGLFRASMMVEEAESRSKVRRE